MPPEARSGLVSALPSAEPHCSPATINRKLSALGTFYEFHSRHGVDCGEVLRMLRPGGPRGAWRPFLAHLGSDKRTRTIKLKVPRRIPRTLTTAQLEKIVECCRRLRDRFLIRLLAEAGLRVGEALGLRHEDIDPAACLIRIRFRNQ